MDSKKISTALVLALLSITSMADEIDVYVGISAMINDVSGDLGSATITQSDEDPVVGFEAYGTFEHSFKYMPNISLRASQTKYDDLDFNYMDANVYWELVDSIVEFDLGFTARFPDVEDTKQNYAYDKVMPMVYTKLEGNLPVVGMAIGATAEYGIESDNQVEDYRVYLEYEFGIGLGFAGGYRVTHNELTLEKQGGNGSIDTNLRIEGGFISAFYHF